MDFTPTGAWAISPIDPMEHLGTLSFRFPGMPQYDMGIYLHGFCTLFALALHDMYEYPISMICDDEMVPGKDPMSHLVHCYCACNLPDGRPVYIDARGMTMNRKKFNSEFEDFFEGEPVIVSDISPEKLKADIEKHIRPEQDRLDLEAVAVSFIRRHPDWFDAKTEFTGKTC